MGFYYSWTSVLDGTAGADLQLPGERRNGHSSLIGVENCRLQSQLTTTTKTDFRLSCGIRRANPGLTCFRDGTETPISPPLQPRTPPPQPPHCVRTSHIHPPIFS
jgi:hypothetical protein